MIERTFNPHTGAVVSEVRTGPDLAPAGHAAAGCAQADRSRDRSQATSRMDRLLGRFLRSTRTFSGQVQPVIRTMWELRYEL